MRAVAVKRARSSTGAESSGTPGQAADPLRDRVLVMIQDNDPTIAGGHTGPRLEFRRWLLNSWGEGGLTDKELCTIAWFSSAAHAVGVSEFGANPTSRGDHHRSNIASGLNLPLDALTYIVKNVPLWNSDCNANVQAPSNPITIGRIAECI